MASFSWVNRFPKARVHILSFVVLLSVILIGFAYIYGQNIDSAPAQNVAQVNQAKLIFYLITMPAISIIHVIAEFLFFVFLCPWSALTQLIISIILVLGWITQASFWVDCEVVLPHNDFVPAYCPQAPLQNGGLDRNGGEAIAKNVVIWIAAILYIINAIMVAITFNNARKRKPILESEENGEHFTSFQRKAAFPRIEERTYSGWDQNH